MKIYPSIGTGNCRICGTSAEGPATLVAIDGTEKDNICEAAVVHCACIIEGIDSMRIKKDFHDSGSDFYYAISTPKGTGDAEPISNQTEPELPQVRTPS